MHNAIIIGSGHYLPKNVIKNDFFMSHEFYDETGELITKPNEETIRKFQEITEIEERRYADADMQNSDMAAHAAREALADAGVDKEDLDYVLVASNYGEIKKETTVADFMPSMSARVKNKLGIKNNQCKPYDMIFGCPGWIEAMILGNQLIIAGLAKKILVVGSDMLSRAVDPHDRTALIFSDGAGAVVLSAEEESKKQGVIHNLTIADNTDELAYLTNGPSLKKGYKEKHISVSMKGRKVYEYALKKVPAAIKRLLEQADVDVKEVKKILIHQANAKMDHAMVNRLYKLYGEKAPADVAPMTVQKFGNSSVATVPTMLDLIRKNQLGGHKFYPGDYVVMASVGAGMTINAVLYKFPEQS